MEFNGWVHENRLPDEDLRTLRSEELIEAHPDWDDHYVWEISSEPSLLDQRLNELALGAPDRVKSLLKTSHDIVRAAVEEDDRQLLDVMKQYFYRAFKRFRQEQYSGSLPRSLRRYDSEEFFHEFMTSVSDTKYGDWEGFVQHTINENWDDGRFMSYFSKTLRGLIPGKTSDDLNYCTRTLRRSVRKILENRTAIDLEFERIELPRSGDRFLPEQYAPDWSTEDCRTLEVDRTFEERRDDLDEVLPETLYYRKDNQESEQFQLHVPDLKPVVTAVYETLRVPISEGELVEFLSERYGVASYRSESLEHSRSETGLDLPSDAVGEGSVRTLSPEERILEEEESSRALEKISSFLERTVGSFRRYVRAFERNGRSLVRAYGVDGTELSDRQQLESIKSRAEEFFVLHMWLTVRRSNPPVEAFREYCDRFPVLEHQSFDGEPLDESDSPGARALIRHSFGYKRAKYYELRNSIEEHFGIDFFDEETDEQQVGLFSDQFFRVCDETGFPSFLI